MQSLYVLVERTNWVLVHVVLWNVASHNHHSLLRRISDLIKLIVVHIYHLVAAYLTSTHCFFGGDKQIWASYKMLSMTVRNT